MAGTAGEHFEETHKHEDAFQWDENSQLYYHASTGFYHDPVAGWYYCSRDGRYYKFENENYVLLGSDHGNQSPIFTHEGCDSDNTHVQNVEYGSDSCNVGCNVSSYQGVEPEAGKVEPSSGHSGCMDNTSAENEPPSEWLEDTLIELYLSGYSSQTTTDVAGEEKLVQSNIINNLNVSKDGEVGFDDLEEGEWIPDDSHHLTKLSAELDEGASWEEENWRARYGQVTYSTVESHSDIKAVDLWDWAVVRETSKDRKLPVTKLVGRRVKSSNKLHPAVPSGGALLKTAPICAVHLDLVQVASGQVYKLHTPSAQYLSSLSNFDSSNPTKDWGFRQLSTENQGKMFPKSGGMSDAKLSELHRVHSEVASSSEELYLVEKGESSSYRDRAAERRALHGGFGVGLGQKKLPDFSDSVSSSVSVSPEEAAEQSLSMSFGKGSYARRILQSMGWKEGDTLGRSSKGLTEPLQVTGNKGNAGLGWGISSRKLS